jgi:large repetitive protein
MLNYNFLRPYPRLVLQPKSQWGLFLSAVSLLFLFFHAPQRAESQTCSFDSYILASNNPFGACPVGTDTIIIRDSFLVDINYEPIIGGVPFEGLFLVDGGVIQWTANAFFKLGPAARVVLINGGIFRPASSNAPDCNSMRALYFDTKKTVDCNGSTAPHAFSDVNNAGCVTQQGICCNAFIIATDSSGNPNDLTLCQPGDTVQLAVLASGVLNYSFFWSPDIGPGAGPYVATPTNNTNYSVNLTAIFDPYGIEPPYLLTCGGSVTVRINKPINVTATTTSVPCLDVPVGGISLTVIGGSPGYTYLWSTGATTKNLTNIPGGPYTVTITDSKGCIQIFSTTVPVLDNIPPTLTCPGNATGTANAGVCTTLIPNINAVFSDNCPTVGVNYALSGATTGSGSGQLSNAVLFSSGITTATYTVNDGANTVSCNFTVTVNDTQLPTASNPLPLSGIPCLAAVPAPDPNVVTTETDNCSVASVVHVSDVIASGSGCPGDTLVLLRSYRVSDAAGNSITVTQTIRVVDNVPPAFTSVPVNVLVNCQSIPNVGTPTASDNCGGGVNIAYNGETRTDGACPDTYIIRRRWTATDGCGNTATAEQILTVQDVTPPVFTTVPAAVTVSCDAIPTVGTPAATDNCDMGVTIVYNGQTRSDGACIDAYTLRRRWIATDNCGNTATAEQVIVVQDVAQPAFTFVPANITVSCNAVPSVGTPAASDNCDTAVSILYNGETRTDGTCPDTYTLVRRWTATDNCGNTTSAVQTIFVQDATPPSFTTFPGNLTIGCDAIPAVGNPSAADNCSANVTILYLGETRNNGTCLDNYTLLRRWRATDACGNSTVATQTLTVRDLVAPVFNFVPANATISCDAVPPVGTPVAADNCAGLATINYDGQTRTDGPCPDTYTLRRRWTAADNCGNTRTAEQILTIQDVTPPVFTTVPAAVTVNCDGIPSVGAPNASDNCDANVTITYNGETRINGSCSDNYTLVRRWTATDNCGNTATAQQLLTVQDLTSPFFTFVPSNATVNCEEIPSMGMPLAADNCDNNVTITFAGVTQASGNCSSGGTVTRRWIATDNCGNTAIAEQMLTVQDTTKPVFLLVPANVTVSCESVPVPGVPEAADNCTSQVEINYNGAVRTNGPCPNTYSLLRRWTATDLCGNTALAEQTITVQDLTPPVFTFVPGNSIVSCNAVPVVGAPEATDNCDNGVAITYDGEIRTNGACPDSYTLQRKWTAADNCGNKVTATQVLVVQDITKPVFTAFPANATVSCENIPAVETPMASDNCTSNVIISFNGETREDGPCTNTFMLKRQWTIADNCGNTSSAVQVITVQDLTTPKFTFVPADVTVPCESVPPVGTPVASDNCTANVLVSFNGETRVDGPCTNSYILKRQWTAADVCGNTASVAQFITVQDVKRPVFTFSPPNVTVDCENVPPVAVPTAIDNCAATVLIVYEGETRTNGVCPDTYTIVRRWTAADFCGNVESVNQIITVRDEGRPMFTFVPANVTVDCSDIPAVGTPTATDNCAAAVTISYAGETRVNGSCPDSYSLIRRWTATDNCGNTEEAQQVISVQDILPPVFTLVPADATVSCDDVPAVGAPQATDNCTATVAIVFQGETRTDGACPGSYTLLRRWIATDNCGNSTMAEQLLTVQDVIQPIFTFIPANVTVDCQNIPVAGAPTAADNCTDAVTIAFVGETRTNGSCPDTYSLVRRWTAMDNCGNSASAEQTITVQDVILPVFTFVPPNVTVECNAIPLLGQPTATDNCTATVNISFLGETRLDGTCPDSYMLERRWTATDNCGNATTALQTIVVRDVTPPVFSFVPPDATVNCEAVPAIGTPVVSDNCDQNVSVTVTTELQTGSDCSTSGVLLRRWTAVDNCGNAAVAEQRLTVQDTTKPVFTLIPDDLTVDCSNVPAVGVPIATDNCTSTVSIVYDGEQRVDGSCPDTYILIRRWTATDICGNIEMADQVIAVQDLTAPVFTVVPNDVTISCESVPAVGTPVATDGCDTDVLIVYDGETRANGACPDTYILTRKWTARDNCGNTIAVTQSIVVQDLSAPVFTFVPASVTVSCDAVPLLGSPAATDNCDADATITFDGEIRTNGSCLNTYTLTRRWTAADNCGNTVSAEQVINVQDNTAPVFTFVPASATVNCEEVPSLGAPMASDNCTQNVAVVFEGEIRTDGICPDTYTLTRRWRATDDCGNATTAEQLLTVQDIRVPVFTFIPADTVVGCDAVPQPALPTATDNCDADVQIIYEGETVISSTSSGTYNLQRSWTARDNCGNSAQITQLLVVRDTVAPDIVCPADIQVDADGAQCAAVVVFNAPAVSDNCTTSPVVVGSSVSGAVFPVATTVVVFDVTDDSGNTASCSFSIVVSDTTAPVLVNCPFDFTVTTPNGDCSTAVIWDDPLVTDACDGYPIVPQPNIQPFSVFQTGLTTVVYTAQDSTGNIMTCSFVVTVQESIPPVLVNCPTDIVLYTDTCTALATWIEPQATDNCESVTVVPNIPSGTVFPETTTTVVYTASDIWGNTTTCSFNVTVIDTISPQFSGCPADTVVSSGGACSIAVDWQLPVATDNCTTNPLVYATPMPGDQYPVGYTNVQVIVEDPSGNKDVCVFKVTVIGPPLGFTDAPLDQSFVGCSAVAVWTPPVPTGVCAPAIVESNYLPGDTFPVGITVVTYSVTDTLGYSATASFTISVTESIPPAFDCPASPVVVDISGAVVTDIGQFVSTASPVSTCDGVVLAFDLPLASDNCSVPFVEQTSGAVTGDFFALGDHLLKFKTTDDAGNTALCSVQVQVVPLNPLAPEVSDKIGCAGDDIVIFTPAIPGATYTWTGPKPPYPNSNNLLIENLSPALTGIYTVQALVNGCLTPLDSALVRQAQLPNAVDDLDFEAETGGLLENFSVLLNDTYEDDDFTITVTGPLLGLTDLGNGNFTYQAGPSNGRVNFIYKLCSEACPDLCDEAVVTITVRETFCSYIPNIITPNDDGINDYLEIPCLNTDLYPNNTLIIYNQWGDKVYEASPYENTPDKAWRGTFKGRPGQNVPDGTYFYYFRPDPTKGALSGFLEIFR